MFKKRFTRKTQEVEWEPLPNFTSLDQTTPWSRKYLSQTELSDAKEKLFLTLTQDLKMNGSLAKLCVEHVLGIKAMYNAGYPRDYIKKLLVTSKLVQELRDTKVKLSHMNKQYARASNTIFELKSKLALGWRRTIVDEFKYTLDRIEKIQRELMEKK